MKFSFIAKHRAVWPVAWMCEALSVSRSVVFDHEYPRRNIWDGWLGV